jgi:general secretion pathway protein G
MERGLHVGLRGMDMDVGQTVSLRADWQSARAAIANRRAALRQRRRRGQRGLTLVELIVAFTIMLILTTMAVPLARSKVRAEREGDLRACLREMRDAIDKYHDLNMALYFGPMKEGTDGYPESLDMLVEGVKVNNAQGTKMRFLRRIPRDPFTGKNEWGLRSDQDETTAQSWGGQNVFDVYSKTSEKGSDGTPYSEW